MWLGFFDDAVRREFFTSMSAEEDELSEQGFKDRSLYTSLCALNKK